MAQFDIELDLTQVSWLSLAISRFMAAAGKERQVSEAEAKTRNDMAGKLYQQIRKCGKIDWTRTADGGIAKGPIFGPNSDEFKNKEGVLDDKRYYEAVKEWKGIVRVTACAREGALYVLRDCIDPSSSTLAPVAHQQNMVWPLAELFRVDKQIAKDLDLAKIEAKMVFVDDIPEEKAEAPSNGSSKPEEAKA